MVSVQDVDVVGSGLNLIKSVEGCNYELFIIIIFFRSRSTFEQLSIIASGQPLAAPPSAERRGVATVGRVGGKTEPLAVRYCIWLSALSQADRSPRPNSLAGPNEGDTTYMQRVSPVVCSRSQYMEILI